MHEAEAVAVVVAVAVAHSLIRCRRHLIAALYARYVEDTDTQHSSAIAGLITPTRGMKQALWLLTQLHPLANQTCLGILTQLQQII